MSALHLFEGFGVELEYMIVQRDTLDVLPIADRLLEDVRGTPGSDYELGSLAWSNELVLHVIELKTNGPAASLVGLAEQFQEHVSQINRRLAPHGACLMPTAMHPWMSPERETKLWPHECNDIYRAFDRIFDCRGHGWSNLQSTHLNLPFANAEEFGRLHAAIRLLLPILPALAASSPLVEGRLTGLADTRLEYYRDNAARVPSVSGGVIPEPAYTPQTYQDEILARVYRDIAPHDPAGILQHEWLNARGAIARFDRGAIEIRVLDIQECPAADLAVLALIVAVLEALVEERWSPLAAQQAWPIAPLQGMLLGCIRDADHAMIENRAYLAALGVDPPSAMSAGCLWRHLADVALTPTLRARCAAPLETIFTHGVLARRIRNAVGRNPHPVHLARTYDQLCRCLAEGAMFV